MTRVAILASLLCACGAEPGSPPPVGPPPVDEVWPETGDSSSTGSPARESTGDGLCRAVDLLFIIDNSLSMQEEQDSLVASFPGFIGGIEELLGPTTSYHVGVITTDRYAHNDDDCRQIGALTTRTGGLMSSDRACGPFAAGGGYMTAEDDLSTAFACAAHVGIDGAWDERPMDALRHTLSGDPPQIAACNAGFLRDEALLVIVLITDEDDVTSFGNPGTWHDTITRAKDEASIVLLSLLSVDDACQTEPSPRLTSLTHRFQHGLVRDICAPDYAPFFAEALESIATACELPVG